MEVKMEDLCFPILNENDVKQRSIFTVNNKIQVVFITNLKTGKKLDDVVEQNTSRQSGEKEFIVVFFNVTRGDYNVNEYLQAVVQANLLRYHGISVPEQLVTIIRSDEIDDDKTTVVIALDIVTNVQDGVDELRCSISEEGLYSESEEQTSEDSSLWNQQVQDMPEQIDNSAEPSTGPSLRWNSEMTRRLIKMRGDMDREFSQAKYKFRLWEQVAIKLNETLPVKVSAKDCDDKWRNIVATYRKNIDKIKCCGDNIIRWEYFTAMDDILHGTKELVNDFSEHYFSDESMVKLMDTLDTSEVEMSNQTIDLISISDDSSPIEEIEVDDFDEGLNDCIITRKLNGERRKWTTEQCLLLIHLRKQMENEFKKSYNETAELWKDLTSQMNTHFLSDFNPSELESVWNHCNINYEMSLENLKSKGVNTVSWKYFAVMDDVREGTQEIAELCVPRPGEHLLRAFHNLSQKRSVSSTSQPDCSGFTSVVQAKDETDSEDTLLSFSGVIWTQDMVKLLISLKKVIEQDIAKHKIVRKKQWWIMVHRFRALKNVKVTEEACEEKWRNLVRTYKKNLVRVRKRGTGIIRWPYFWNMHEILGSSIVEYEKQSVSLVDSTVNKPVIVESLDLPPASNEQTEEVLTDSPACTQNEDLSSVIIDLRDKQNQMLNEIIDRQNKKIEELHREQLNIKSLLTQLLQKFP